MKRRTGIIIRPFSGSLEDAEGLLLVERATFDESPYSPAEVQALLDGGSQHAWLALAGDEVVGFVAAFVTGGLSGPCWEIDLLAVHPGWAGQGAATRLIRAAAAYGARLARRARAVVALENEGSARAFQRAGFRVQPEVHELLIARLEELPRRPSLTVGLAVRPAGSLAELLPWRPDLEADETLDAEHGAGRLSLLVAEQKGEPAGYAELLRVQTLLYRGIWIESLAAHTAPARGALVRAAVEQAAMSGLDEIGAMVANEQQGLKDALRAADLASLGEFRWAVAELPLPGLAAASPSEGGGHPIGKEENDG